MQKLLTVIVFLVLCQLSYSQLRMGILGGPQSSSVKESNSIPNWQTDIKQRYSNRSGINLGILVEAPISRHLYFQPGLMYSSKGRKYFQRNDSTASIRTDTITAASNTGINYMEMPLNLTLKLPLTAKARFILSAGPYVGFFLNGKQKRETRIYSSNEFKSEEAKIEVGNAEGKVKTFDAGFNLRGGFELGNVLLTGFMSQGLTSFYTAPYHATFRHQVKGVSVGFWLSPATPVAKPKKVIIPSKPAPVIVIPVPDTDGDGLNDEADGCPNMPGPVEFNGCPIPDSDGDGTNDKEDKCPAERGPKDNGGCPVIKVDTIRKEVVEKLNYVASNIMFTAGSDELSPASKPLLDEVVDVLKAHPTVNMSIEGHTDSSGNPEHNRELSQKRAASVKKYLVDMGIDVKRLTSTGFGSDRPIATNSTPQGRMRNRRVELKIIQ